MKILLNKHHPPKVDLTPDSILNGDGSVHHLVLANKTIRFKLNELVHNFNKEHIAKVGQPGSPKDAVHLMANLIFLPVVIEIQFVACFFYKIVSGTYAGLSPLKQTGGNSNLIPLRNAASL